MSDDQDKSVNVKIDKPGGGNIVYILYLSSILLGITSIIGVIMAYINRKDAEEWEASHYTFQIHTFWKLMLFSFIGVVLSIVLIGFIVLLVALVWFIIRCIKGMKAYGNGEPIENPKRWGF